MARRNLLAEAQVQAAAQTAPQVAALSEALTQARIDRNSAIRAAAAANAGISHAIHLAGPSVKEAYTGAQKLAAPPQGYSDGRYASAAGNEQRLGTTALASSLANSLRALSDRRISAAAGRAFATSKAEANYEGNAASIATKRQALASQEGLLTASALSKLTEALATRKNSRLMQERSLNSQAALQGERLNSQATLQTERLASSERVAGAHIRSSEHTAALGRRQQKLGRIDTAKRQAKQLAATGHGGSATTPGGASKLTPTEQKGRITILQIRQQYQKDAAAGKSMTDTANGIRGGKGAPPEPLIGAGADLHSKGYVSPENVQKLKALGVSVPKEWQGTQVRAHTRKPRRP